MNGFPSFPGGNYFTGIAQLVEHRSPKPRVVGSSPPSRANICFPYHCTYCVYHGLMFPLDNGCCLSWLNLQGNG